MKNKKILFALIIILFIVSIIAVIIIKINANYTLVQKTIYKYPIKTEFIINNKGEVKKSSYEDELTVNGPPKGTYETVRKISEKDLQDIKDIINIMNKETLKDSNYSEDYDLSIMWNNDKNTLCSCQYFSQENVDKLNSIISRYIY